MYQISRLFSCVAVIALQSLPLLMQCFLCKLVPPFMNDRQSQPIATGDMAQYLQRSMDRFPTYGKLLYGSRATPTRPGGPASVYCTSRRVLSSNRTEKI